MEWITYKLALRKASQRKRLLNKYKKKVMTRTSCLGQGFCTRVNQQKLLKILLETQAWEKEKRYPDHAISLIIVPHRQ